MNEEELKALEQERMDAIDRAEAALQRLVKELQDSIFEVVTVWAAESLATDSGAIVFSAGNLSKVQGLFQTLARAFRSAAKKLLSLFLAESGKIDSANARYFSGFSDEVVRAEARRRALLTWGYDSATKELLAGGWLESVFGPGEITRKIGGLVNSSIVQRLSLSAFREMFSRLFQKAGMLVKHWNTAAFDLFQRYDRAVQVVYAEKLNLSHALYAGTVMERSRPFCVARAGKVFTFAEIEAWSNLSWSGKNEPYDPFLNCGGYQCRHHLSIISKGLYDVMKAKEKAQ